MGGGRGAGAAPRRFALPERRRQADRPVDRARRGAGGTRAPPAAEHHSLGQVDRDRPAIGRCAAGLTRDLAVGHYKPINSDRFLNDCHEFIFHFTPQGRPRSIGWRSAFPIRTSRTSARWRGAAGGVRCRGNTWFIPYETIQRRDRDRPHPATFPSRLPEQCLRLHGSAADWGRHGSVYGPRQHRRRVRAPGRSTSSEPRSTRPT